MLPALNSAGWDKETSFTRTPSHGNTETEKSPFNAKDPQSVLNPILRAANRACYNHFLSLNIPGIIIKSDPIDPSTLNDLAKSAIALDLKLELDEEVYIYYKGWGLELLL